MKTYNTNDKAPTNPRNNCICDSGIPCYYHVKKGAWYNKSNNEQIFPVVWSYALLPSTPTASFDNLFLVLCQFGENTFKQEFAKLAPDKQRELFDEWQFTKESLTSQFE